MCFCANPEALGHILVFHEKTYFLLGLVPQKGCRLTNFKAFHLCFFSDAQTKRSK